MLSHLLVAALVVAMVNLGFWQVRRLDERRGVNALVESRRALPVDDVALVVEPGVGTAAAIDAAAGATYRRVSATGAYDTANEVVVRSRSLGGRPGVWVLTPLVLDGGEALVVNRGFVAVAGTPDGVPTEAAAPIGDVEVEGLLRPTQEHGRFGATDPPEGRLPDLARADLVRLQQQVPYELYPVYLDLATQSPPVADLPVLLPEPELDDGPHLGYAAQWFIFSAIATFGYPLILRRQARAFEAGAGSVGDAPAGNDGGRSSDDGSDRDPVPASR